MQLISEFMLNPTAQLVGILAFFASAFSASQKDETKLRNYMALSAFVWVVHHFLLHSYTAAVLLFFIAIRCYISSIVLNKEFSFRLLFAISFILLNGLISYFTWEGYHSIFAFTAATIATIAVLLTRGLWTRLLLILVEILWLAYNIHVGSFGGVIACLTDGSILAIVLYKDFILNKSNEQKIAIEVA